MKFLNIYNSGYRTFFFFFWTTPEEATSEMSCLGLSIPGIVEIKEQEKGVLVAFS